ncbi:ABC transporter permease [Promicromonospora citrea]|uniref:ABC transporter permease n=1 Tax=Promicromonospora citrea TaxID=43677 RepID=A0A8H9GLW0_9MICO|nr:FtsX-like permease family protein [Promicromonospora citrea]NNH53831.1 FtsX-like permease family protein [Promicromonospora citrea]GGM37672.1 ABC transporter permease [Promicromonospora citrea]
MTATLTPPTTTPTPQPGTRFPTARLTLGQMRRSTGRLTAAGVAILISTAFVAVTLLAGGVINGTTHDMVAAQYADADVVVSVPQAGSGSFGPETVEAIGAVDGVAAVQPLTTWFGDLRNGGKGGFQAVAPVPSDPRLSPLELTDGTWPAAGDEVVLTTRVADRLEVGIGDTVTVHREIYPEGWNESTADDPATELGEPEEVRTELTVTGITEDPYGAFTSYGGTAAVPAATLDEWRLAEPFPDLVQEVLVALDTPLPGDVPSDLRDALLDATAGAGDTVSVQTADEVAAQRTAEQTGGQDIVFLVFVMTFAAIALLIAAMVITNTFQVLVAQRTRTLALLRCIGAGTGQLYRSVLLEAAILGLVASVAGIVVGAGLAQLALAVAPGFDLGVPLPATITVTTQTVLLPLAVGVGVTVLAAIAPARSATRVAPLAALRPSDAPTLRARAGRTRLVVSILCLVAGFAALGLGVFLGMRGATQFGLVAAVGGGALAFFGVVLSAVLWLPRVAAGLGNLVSRTGPAARLAVANTLRNPRRTAATSTALLIGVTLVTMMSTGAASARMSADALLDESFPFDVSAVPSDDRYVQDVRDAVAGTDGVGKTTLVTRATVTVGGSDTTVNAVQPGEFASVVNVPEDARMLEEGFILLSSDSAGLLGVGSNDVTTVEGPNGTIDLTVLITSSQALDHVMTAADFARITGENTQTEVWGTVTGSDPAAVLTAVQNAVAQADGSGYVVGPVAQAEQFRQVVDVILGIVVGLLAVAVVIALIGVTNTLSLSVIERTRESATLRAIGLDRGQLRAMLAVEGMLIAGVGAVLGIVLGLIFGWSGAATALALMGEVRYAVPLTDIALVLGISLVAGLLASVVPARTAVRTPPVAALAVE